MAIRSMLVRALAVLILGLAAPVVRAQGSEVPFGGLSHDSTQPVEITADQLDLDQAAGVAVFTGTVRVGQGELRLAADRLEVFYADSGGTGTGQVERMRASGSVTLSNGAEAAEAQSAVYDVSAGTVEMAGDVLLTQGANALASERLVIDLTEGTGRLDGRVRTIFAPEGAGQ